MSNLLLRRSLLHGIRLASNGSSQVSLATSARLFCDEPPYMTKREKMELKEKKDIDLKAYEYFSTEQTKNKENFRRALDHFVNRDIRRRGAVEFIRAALKNMKAFGVHRDLEAYKAILEVLPKGKYVVQNVFQSAFVHYPKQQECALHILEAMRFNMVIPDEHFGELLKMTFGFDSRPYKRYARLRYWMPKFNNLSHWPLPFHLPNDAKDLAKLAILQIISADPLSDITEYECCDLEESTDKTWIISGQSPLQKDMISKLNKRKALFVEGAFRVWLQDKQVNYFVLRGEGVPKPPPPDPGAGEIKKENVKNWVIGEHHSHDLIPLPNVHQQEDGTILGCCATGTSSKDSLLSWIRFLQRDNPGLEDVAILFSLTSPFGPVVPLSEEEIKGKTSVV